MLLRETVSRPAVLAVVVALAGLVVLAGAGAALVGSSVLYFTIADRRDARAALRASASPPAPG